MARSLEFAGANHDPPVVARWIVPAIVVSLLFHILLMMWARDRVVHGMSSEYLDKIVPRTFRIDRVEIDPRLLQPEPAVQTASAMVPVPVKVPEERISFDKMASDDQGKPASPKVEPSALSEKPPGMAADFSATLATAQATGAESLLEDDKSLTETLLAEKPTSGPIMPLDPMPGASGSPGVPEGVARGGNQPGFSNLDDLLAATGPLSGETAPILMPTDLLFDYDAANLQPQAVESLAKLGTLIQRNPRARFTIEGHTDSFGSDEYNEALSTRRAESVKAWLVMQMRIPANQIETVGYGKSRLIAPASGTIEEQQINRRVEIVIRTDS